MTPEEEARQVIDEKLDQAGWKVQDRSKLDLSAGRGIAVREFPLKSGHGDADYLLYVDRKAIGVVEAKPNGSTLTGVEPQSARYSEGLPDNLPAYHRPLPFLYEATGEEIRFTNGLEPNARSRDIFHFHTPDSLLDYVRKTEQLREKLKNMPPLIAGKLWPAQITAINNLERSLAHGYPRALIQMATGSGKTFTAANFAYRLIKHANAHRILFLVDRDNLAKQAEREIRQFQPPDDNRRFADLYNIQRMTSNSIGRASRLCICTVQRMFSMLKGDELDPELEQGSMFDSAQPLNRQPPPIDYNHDIPIDAFDFIVIDECHRSIYNQWRQVLEYFDAFLIGLTATPSAQTIGYFNRNLVMQYPHAQAVADGVNVNYDVYRIRTQITEGGSTVHAGKYVDKRDRLTRKTRYELLDDDLTYSGQQLDRDVVAPDQIRTIVRTFRDNLFTEIFPGRTEVPKTLIFAKDDSHAEDIVKIIREEFGKGSDFCQKITYRTGFMKIPNDPDDESKGHVWKRVSTMSAEDILTIFRNSYNPRIAVTVDMVATGTDVKPLEIVMFMRNVQSCNFFEQMKGRGVRIISDHAFQAVTPDAKHKTRFVIVDAVGVCEQDKTETKSLNTQPSVPLKKILNSVAMGDTQDDTLSTLASRMARLARELTAEQRDELEGLVDGKSLESITGNLVRAIDPDAQIEKARELHSLADLQQPTEEQVQVATHKLKQEAVEPFLKADFRNRLLEIQQQNEQTIDTVSLDTVLEAGYDAAALEKAKSKIEDFRKWLEDNKDQITALQLIYSQRYGNQITYAEVEDLAKRIQRPPIETTGEQLWRAYEALDKSKVRGRGGKQVADIVSLIRHTISPDEPLTPFASVVMDRFANWLSQQEAAGADFTDEQCQWLAKIAEHIGTSVVMERDDFDYGWFAQHGSLGKAHALFGDRLDAIMTELNEGLVA